MVVRKLQCLFVWGMFSVSCFVNACTSDSPDDLSKGESARSTQANIESGSAVNKRGYREIIVAEHTFVEIPEGTFQMGSPESEADRDDNETRHQVELTRGFDWKDWRGIHLASSGAEPQSGSAIALF